MVNQGDIHQLWRTGGARIRSLREGWEITQLELAEQIDAPSVNWVEEVESGKRPINSAFYKSFAKCFRLSAQEFARDCLKHYDPKAYEALFGEHSNRISKVA